MDSTRPIRALMRGLDALCALNARDGATVADVVHDIRLPRTTVYRVLETLGEAGYVYRDPRDDRYRLTRFVRALSDGFDEDAWIARIALPRVGALSRSLGWPVAIATPSGARMLLRESSDRRAALRVPLATSAAGLAYLAYTPSAQREALVGALGRGAPSPQRAPADFDRLLDDVRAQGFASSPAAASRRAIGGRNRPERRRIGRRPRPGRGQRALRRAVGRRPRPRPGSFWQNCGYARKRFAMNSYRS